MSRLRTRILVICLSFAGVSCRPMESQSRIPHNYDDRKGDLSVGYSFLSNSFNGHSSAPAQQPLNGWDASASARIVAGLSLVVDVFGYRGTSFSYPQDPIFVTGGVRYAVPLGHISPFVEGLVGGGFINKDWFGLANQGTTTSFAGVAGGGFDTALTKRLLVRVSADLLHTQFTVTSNQLQGTPSNFARVSTGLVMRF